MKRATATACACGVAALAQTVAAGAATIALPSPNTPGPAPPPLAGGPQLSAEPGEVRVPGSLDNAEAVRVGLAQDGTPVSVVVVQQLSIRGLGDFRFVVPAPRRRRRPRRRLPVAARAAAGRHRLAGVFARPAAARRPHHAAADAGGRGPAAPHLGRAAWRRHPRAAREPDGQAVRDHARVGAPAGAPGRARAHPAGVGHELAAGRPLPVVLEQVEGRATVPADTSRSTPRCTSPGRSRSPTAGRPWWTRHSGGAYPRSRVVALRGDGRVTIALDAAFERDRRRLLPTAHELASSSDPLLTLQTALARTAVALQFQQYLASPTPGGASTTTYGYATARVAAVAPAESGGDDGPGALVPALIAIGGLAVLGGLTVLWAHLRAAPSPRPWSWPPARGAGCAR